MTRRCRCSTRRGGGPAATAAAPGPARPATARRPAGARRRRARRGRSGTARPGGSRRCRAGTPARRRARPRAPAARLRRWPVRRACPSSSAAIACRPGTCGRRSRSIGASPSTSSPAPRSSLATSGVADIASRRRSGRTVLRASSANARPRSVAHCVRGPRRRSPGRRRATRDRSAAVGSARPR